MTGLSPSWRSKWPEISSANLMIVICPAGHEESMHSDEKPAADPFFCGGCGHVFGTFAEVHARLFTAGDMLAAALATKR
jgi:hypothetical protein